MVNEYGLSPEELNQRFVHMEQEIAVLKKLLNNHLGHQTGAITANLPHPQMSAISRGKFTFTNGTVDRVIDCDSTTLAELADIVYTIWLDLSEIKTLG